MPESNFEVPVIRNASPYMSEAEMRRLIDKKQKEGFVGEKDFKAIFGKATLATENHFIPNYVSKDPSQPPLLHQYRDEDK